jgi:hypothetical protein
MKLPAFILLSLMSTFIVEVLVFSFHCAPTTPADPCIMKCEQSSCKKVAKQQSKKKACDANKYFDCPLFSVYTVQPFNSFERWISQIESRYLTIQENNLSDYVHQQWKPPNAISPSRSV